MARKGAVIGLLASAAIAGCGGSSSSSAPDVRGFATTAGQISTAASTYGTTAAAATDVPGCQSVHSAYDGQVHPMVDRMRSMSGGMDDQWMSMGHPEDADVSCGADAMAAELARHDAAACTSADMRANHAESARHATAMEGWAQHEQTRADDMGGMMGMSGMGGGGGSGGGGGTNRCHRNDDGTFTLGP
jgi:hypothetical protein